jgi:NADPH:quinone reductase
MRAWRLEHTGEPHTVLSLEDVVDLEPGPGELLLEVEAAGVTMPDLLQIQGLHQLPLLLPCTPGTEVAGLVSAVGAGCVTPVGTRVVGLALAPSGAYAEQAIMRESSAAAVPPSVASIRAAALPTNYVTAHLALHTRAELRAGEFVLILGGAGGVGTAAIQVALAAHARVIATDLGARQAQLCRDIGAECVIDATDDTTSLRDAVMDFTEGHGADVVIDTVGGDAFDQARRCVAFEGRLVVVGFSSGRIPELKVNRLILGNFSVLGVNAATYHLEHPAVFTRICEKVVAQCEGGYFVPVTEVTPNLEGLLDALGRLSRREVVGKAVLDLRAESGDRR